MNQEGKGRDSTHQVRDCGLFPLLCSEEAGAGCHASAQRSGR